MKNTQNGKLREPKIVAEIGCNHCGDFQMAKEMVMVAAQFCKADVAKFQKRAPRECLTHEEYNSPHPVARNSYGNTYGEHRNFLEFNLEQHRRLKDVCEAFNIQYSSSVWDLTSAKEIISLQPSLIKVPSSCNTYQALLEILCDSFGGDIHLSLGMTTRKEEDEIVEFLLKKGRLKDVVLYHCTSGYPVPFEDLNLVEITRLCEMYKNEVKSIGFSGHHLGISSEVVAFTLGADWVERHFTLDRTLKGTDHAASLEPDGLRRVVRNLRQAALTLQHPKKEILDIEIPTRERLKWDRKHFHCGSIEGAVESEKKPSHLYLFGDKKQHDGKDTRLKDIKLVCVDAEGTLTDGGTYYSKDGELLKRFNTRDAVGLALLREADIKVAIVSEEESKIVEARAKKLDIKDVRLGVNDKERCIIQLISQKKLKLSNLAFIGDDINDFKIIRKAGFSACPGDAPLKIREIVDYVCKNNGGAGAVREFCELILRGRQC